ncbi:hypothetical protein UFOVP4_23 [uncultured Caudovirales phage]|uniref:Uncharacterized protein n=1 Tax=uncultured Caudovirales phage TaxID=2100421 RepID=A0A6J5KG75_9CAUD|nr:hypothetical protein UFOVP4_23 [uncultured Caudovirales phage]
MAQPSPYERIFSFTGVSTATPNAQQPGVQLDAEFNAVRTALNFAVIKSVSA